MSDDNEFGLIPIRNDYHPFVVNARELHKFLISENKDIQTGERFPDWMKRMIDFNHKERKDYIILNFDFEGNLLSTSLQINMKTDIERVTIFKKEYLLTISCAKQIAMVQNNPKGVEARQYFIKCEKKLKEVAKAILPNFNNPAEAARAWADQYEARLIAENKEKEKSLQLNVAEKDKELLKEINQDQQRIIEKNIPKVRVADAINNSKTLYSWKETADVIAQYIYEKIGKRYELGQKKLLEWARMKHFLTQNYKIRRRKNQKTQKYEEYRKYDNQPINKYVQQGWFWVEKHPRKNDPDTIDSTTMLKPKGFIKIINRYIDWFNELNGTSLELFPNH